MADTAITLLLDIHITDTLILSVGLLKTIQVETGIVAHVCLYYLSGEEVFVICGMIAKEQTRLCALFEHYQYSPVEHKGSVKTLRRLQDVDNLHRMVHLDILWHIYQ